MIIFYNKETGDKQVQPSSDIMDTHTKEITVERKIEIPELYCILEEIYQIFLPSYNKTYIIFILHTHT